MFYLNDGYNQSIGRMMAHDAYSSAAPSLSGYRAFLNNPVSVTDPKGNYEISDGYGSVSMGASIDYSGPPPGDYYNQQGKKIGTDGIDDGKMYVVTNNSEVKAIKKTSKGGGTTAVEDVESAVELPSEYVRSEMGKAVERAGSPSFHEEGGYFGTSKGKEFVVHAKPGEEANPLIEDYASINVFKANKITDLPNDADPVIAGTFHTHPDGVQISGNRRGYFENPPSDKVSATGVRIGDIPNAASSSRVVGNSYVLAQGNRTVYIYNGTGTIARLPFKTFFPTK